MWGQLWKRGLPLSKVPAPCLGEALGLKPGQRQAWVPAGPSLSVALASCGLSGPWRPWVMMAVCGRAALVSAGLRRPCWLLPKAASAAAAGDWARVPPASTHGWPSAARSPSQPALACDTRGPTRGFLVASRPRSCPCPAESLPGLLPHSPGEPVAAQGLSIPARCPRADCQPWRLPWGATLPGGSGAGVRTWAQPDRAEALFDHPVAPRAWVAWLGAQPLGWKWAGDRTAVKLRISGCGRFSPGVHRGPA